MKPVEVTCQMCGGEFDISHPMTDEKYRVRYCIFCREEIDEEDIFEINEDE